MARNHHLTYNADRDGWDIRKEGGARPSDHLADHGDALARARELASNADVTLILHDRSGAITGALSGEDRAPGLVKSAADKLRGAAGAVASRFS